MSSKSRLLLQYSLVVTGYSVCAAKVECGVMAPAQAPHPLLHLQVPPLSEANSLQPLSHVLSLQPSQQWTSQPTPSAAAAMSAGMAFSGSQSRSAMHGVAEEAHAKMIKRQGQEAGVHATQAPQQPSPNTQQRKLDGWLAKVQDDDLQKALEESKRLHEQQSLQQGGACCTHSVGAAGVSAVNASGLTSVDHGGASAADASASERSAVMELVGAVDAYDEDAALMAALAESAAMHEQQLTCLQKEQQQEQQAAAAAVSAGACADIKSDAEVVGRTSSSCGTASHEHDPANEAPKPTTEPSPEQEAFVDATAVADRSSGNASTAGQASLHHGGGTTNPDASAAAAHAPCLDVDDCNVVLLDDSADQSSGGREQQHEETEVDGDTASAGSAGRALQPPRPQVCVSLQDTWLTSRL